jgi:hypothetical protein
VPNDAKLGLAAGVAIVLLVAVVFYRTEAGLSLPLNAGGGIAADQGSRPNRPSSNPADHAPARVKPTVEIQGSEQPAGPGKQTKEVSADPVE